MAQDAAPSAPPRRGAGCAIALLAGAFGMVVGIVLTVVLWNLTGPDDAEEASVSALLFIGMFTIPVSTALSIAAAGGWFASRTEPSVGHHRPGRGDEIGLALGFGAVGAVCGVLVALGVWARSSAGGDSGGAVLLALATVFGAFGAVLGAALAIAWHRRGHTA